MINRSWTAWRTAWLSGRWSRARRVRVTSCSRTTPTTAQETFLPGRSVCSWLRHPTVKTGSLRRSVQSVDVKIFMPLGHLCSVMCRCFVCYFGLISFFFFFHRSFMKFPSWRSLSLSVRTVFFPKSLPLLMLVLLRHPRPRQLLARLRPAAVFPLSSLQKCPQVRASPVYVVLLCHWPINIKKGAGHTEEKPILDSTSSSLFS